MFFSFFSGHLQIFPSLLTIKACNLDDRETSTTITIKPTIPVRRGYTLGFLNISFWLPDGLSLKHEHCAVGVEQTKEVSVDVMAQCADFGETTTKLIVPEIHDYHSIFWTPGGSKKFQLPKILVRLFWLLRRDMISSTAWGQATLMSCLWSIKNRALHCISVVIHRNCCQAMIRIVISLHSPLRTRSKGKRDLINRCENELLY